MLDNVFIGFAKYSRKIVGICLLILSIIVISYSAYLLKIDVTESEPKNNVALRFPTPTEYVDNDPFWWLLNGSNNIRMINFSDERMKGIFTIQVYPNPCKDNSIIEVIHNNLKSKSLIKTNANSIKIMADLKPYQSKDLDLRVINSKSCFVSNGDNRDFGVLVSSWKFR